MPSVHEVCLLAKVESHVVIMIQDLIIPLHEFTYTLSNVQAVQALY